MRGTDDDGGVGSQLGEEARGTLEHRLHLPVDLLEELRDLLALCRPQDTGSGQVVDEEAVALVGRDVAGAGAGLDEVPLSFERHHFRAHRGGGHLHAGRAGHVEEPTGFAVPMYSVTTASRMAARRALRACGSSATSVIGVESVGEVMRCLALKSTQCQGRTSGRHWASRHPGGHRTPGLSRHPGAGPRRRPPGAPPPGRCSSSSCPSFCFSSSLRLRVISPP